MDNYLNSGRNAEEAINRARKVQAILGKGDFHLTKWLSNSGKFNQEFQPDSGENAATGRPLGEEEATTKILRVSFSRAKAHEKDSSGYHRGDIRPTRTSGPSSC